MFKGFTWAKFLADLGVVTALVTGPLAGIVPTKVAAILGAVAVAVRAVASLVTTVKAGTATNAAGVAVGK